MIVLLIGTNDLGNGERAAVVLAELGVLVRQLRAARPAATLRLRTRAVSQEEPRARVTPHHCAKRDGSRPRRRWSRSAFALEIQMATSWYSRAHSRMNRTRLGTIL